MDNIFFALQAKSHDKLLLELIQITKDYRDGIEKNLPEIVIHTLGSFTFQGHLLDIDSTNKQSICLLTFKNGIAEAAYISVASIVNIQIKEVEKWMHKLTWGNKIKSDSTRPSNLEIKRNLRDFTTKITKQLNKDISLHAEPESFESAMEALSLLGQIKELNIAASLIKRDALLLDAFIAKVTKINISNKDEKKLTITDQTLEIQFPAAKGTDSVTSGRSIIKFLNDTL